MRAGIFLVRAAEACERFSFCPRFLFWPVRPRISADEASHLRGSVSLGNWRGSRLQTVYRCTEIGARLKLRLGNTGVRSPALFAEVGPPTLPDARRASSSDVDRSPGLGRRRSALVARSGSRFDPSINTHGVGTYNTADKDGHKIGSVQLRMIYQDSFTCVRTCIVVSWDR